MDLLAHLYTDYDMVYLYHIMYKTMDHRLSSGGNMKGDKGSQ